MKEALICPKCGEYLGSKGDLVECPICGTEFVSEE